ncbi:MAG: proteinase inhibitor I78 [Gammaproteobacteria bacterium]|nr:proteinase inhibitor I78 [Gammaproteobacteria bacterium]
MIKTTSATAASVTMAAVLMTTGCTGYGQAPASPPASSPSATAPAPAAPCNAQPAQSAVGQNSTASVMESARVRSGAQMARILRPGQMITKEFNAQRLNLEVDANGRILAVRCG